MPKSTRSVAILLHENATAIEKWRATLPETATPAACSSADQRARLASEYSKRQRQIPAGLKARSHARVATLCRLRALVAAGSSRAVVATHRGRRSVSSNDVRNSPKGGRTQASTLRRIHGEPP